MKRNLGKHITIFYAVLDCEQQQLLYSNAGQYPAPLVQNDGERFLLADGGFPIGLFEWASFETGQLRLAPDFKLLMVSDGWLELLATTTSASQEQQLLAFVADNSISIDSILAPVAEFDNERIPDDVTVFIVAKEEL